jgi:malonyl-CoA/methylmalonyl-CoA synthetase
MLCRPSLIFFGFLALNENIEETRQGMIIYTSGTTGPPKGVVSTHQNIHYQTADLVHAWEYSGSDRIPHFLPLHHMHGIVNKLLCPLWEGATVEFQSKGSDPKALWKRLAESHAQRHSNVKEERERALTIFMAVPTIYATMLEAMPNVDENVLEKGRAGAKDLRLMVSGSAALPISVLQKWEKVRPSTR